MNILGHRRCVSLSLCSSEGASAGARALWARGRGREGGRAGGREGGRAGIDTPMSPRAGGGGHVGRGGAARRTARIYAYMKIKNADAVDVLKYLLVL